MKKTSVLAIMVAAALTASPVYAQDSSQPSTDPSTAPSSEASQPSSQPSSEPSSQASSEPSSQPSSQPSSAQSSAISSAENGGTEAGFSLEIDVSFSFKLTFNQAVEFKKIIVEDTKPTPAPVDANVSVTIGSDVPTTISLQPLPLRIVALYPELEGFFFFLLPDGRIVVVSPATLKIVFILTID